MRKRSEPVPPPTSRGWGINLDYLVVARVGPVVRPGWYLSFGTSPASAPSCRSIGRRIALAEPDLGPALRYATAFWFLAMWAGLGLFVVALIVIGVVDHTALGGPALAFPTLGLALFVTSAIAYAFALVRHLNLGDPVVKKLNRERPVPRSAVPKPYDAAIAILAGVVTFVATIGYINAT